MAISKEIFPYELAIGEFCSSILKNEMSKRPILNWLGEGRVSRHRGVVRNIQGSNPLDQGYTQISGTAQVDNSIVRNTNIPKFVEEVRRMGQEMAKKQATSFFSSLDEIFDHSRMPNSKDKNADTEEEEHVINLVIDQYLESITDERDFDFPFMALIQEMGFYDIHWTHGQWEYGKDFIAKLDVDGKTEQYVFQSKAGDINLQKWRSEIAPQLQEAITNTLSHPNFDGNIDRQIVFVTTGDIVGGAVNASQNWNNDFVQNSLKARKVKFWCKPQLLKFLEQYGLTGIHSTTAAGYADHASFFRFYSDCLQGNVSPNQIELYSTHWLDTSLSIGKRILRSATEAEIFARICLQNGKLYEAIFCYLAAIRVLLHGFYDSTQSVDLVLLKKLYDLALLRVKALSDNYMAQIRQEWNTHNKDLVTAGFGGMFSYLVQICRILEVAGLAYFIEPTKVQQRELANFIKELFAHEPGFGKIPSDRYAVSIIAPIMISIHQGDLVLAKSLIEKISCWLKDRVENGNSIADHDSSEFEEVNTLLGFPDLAVPMHKGGGFLRVVLTDLAALTNDREFFENTNQILEKTIFPTFWQVHDTVGVTLIEGQDIVQYPNISIGKSLTNFDDYAYSEHIVNEIDHISLVEDFDSICLLVLMLLLRDRYFPKQWKRILVSATVKSQRVLRGDASNE